MEDEITSISDGKFVVIDYIIFSSLFLISLILGFYTALKKDNSSTNEYLVGGRSMPLLPVALSCIGVSVSAIAILGKDIFILFKTML